MTKMTVKSTTNKKFLLKNTFQKCKKCAVCGKAIRSNNESGLCSNHLMLERCLCHYHQRFKNEKPTNKKGIKT